MAPRKRRPKNPKRTEVESQIGLLLIELYYLGVEDGMARLEKAFSELRKQRSKRQEKRAKTTRVNGEGNGKVVPIKRRRRKKQAEV